jgi:hypothetical protein
MQVKLPDSLSLLSWPTGQGLYQMVNNSQARRPFSPAAGTQATAYKMSNKSKNNRLSEIMMRKTL